MLERIISMLLTLFVTLPAISANNRANSLEVEPVYLGTPLESYYAGKSERTAWDLEIYDNKLFVSGGDYDKSTGPVPIFYYDLKNNQWIDSGTVPDEQIERFYTFGDTLTAAGADPTGGWELGNYYTFNGNTWDIHRVVPDAIHMHDMVEFDGKLFVGTGVPAGESPICVSEDGGITFTKVALYRENQLLDTAVAPNEQGTIPPYQLRVYDFMVLEDNLYALFYFYVNGRLELSIYRYHDNAFHYYAPLPPNVVFAPISHEALATKVTFQGRVFCSTGRLYGTEDMISYTKITFSEDAKVTDLQVIDNVLYASVYEMQADGTYRVSLWHNETGKYGDFFEDFYFTYPAPAQCFTYCDGVFYFGMGEGILSDANEANGSVLTVQAGTIS